MPIITTEAKFAAALLKGDPLRIRGTVKLAKQHIIKRPARIVFEPGAVLVHESPTWCLDLAAPLIVEHGRIEGLTPKAGYWLNIGGTKRAGEDGRLILEHCSFRKFGSVIVMSGSSQAPLGPRMVLDDCEFSEIGSAEYGGPGKVGALCFGWHLGHTRITGCRWMSGIYGNAVYAAESGMASHALGEPLYIERCLVRSAGRNGFETFSAAKAWILDNELENVATMEGAGIGISCAGGDSVVRGNRLRRIGNYAAEIYGPGITFTENTIEEVLRDDPNPGIGLSIDHCTDSVVANNRFENIRSARFPRHACVVVNSRNVRLHNNDFDGVSYGIWGNTGCEALTVRENEFLIELDAEPRDRGYVPMASIFMSGVRNQMLNNVATVGDTLSTLTPEQRRQLFAFHVGTGGYADLSGKLIGPMSALTGVGNASSNMVI